MEILADSIVTYIMITLLSKLFIKNNKDYSNPKVREQYGVLCGGFGIFLNILLFVFKFIFGTIAASVAMIADAFNNLSDAASSIIQIVGFKLSNKKPDPSHPFGHGRIEYLTGLLISLLVLLMGIELFKSSVNALINPQPVSGGFIPVIVMVTAILVKFYMYLFNHSIAKKIDSVAMEATAKDSFGDMISNLIVIVSIVVSKFTSFPVDGICGIIVALLIIKTGIESARDTIRPLLGTVPSAELVDAIEKELLDHKPIVGMHDLVIHDYGPGRKMISLHAEVPCDRDIFELHDVIDVAEVDIGKKFNCEVVIHMDPVDVSNPRLDELKSVLKSVCSDIDSELMFHDVRMVPGITHTNLIFDIVKPFSCKITDEELKFLICKEIHNRCKDVFCVITVDLPYV